MAAYRDIDRRQGGAGGNRRGMQAGRAPAANDRDYEGERGPQRRDQGRNQGNRINHNINRQRQNDAGGEERGGRREKKPVIVGYRFLSNLLEREPADIVLTLSNPNVGFREALLQSKDKEDILVLLLSVLAKAFSCNSTDENLNRLYIIIKEAQFFDTSSSYFLDMQTEERENKLRSFQQPIKDMISIMSQLIVKHPTSVTQFLGIYEVLKMVINALRETANIIDDDLLETFQDFTDHKEQMLRRRQRSQRPNKQDIEHKQDGEDPPDNFRDIQIFPQNADMQANDDKYLRRNKIKGQYQDLDHYLDVQFRLLREDFVAPLRDGIREYIQAVEENGKHTKKNSDVRMYYNVKIITPECTESGLVHVLQFDVSNLGRVRWSGSKRLIFGSLICLSSDNFQTIFFATVVDRDIKLLERGIAKVKFEHDHRIVKTLFRQQFTMAETTAYFESYRHVLTGLQKIRPNDLPFEKYIIRCESQVQAPGYVQRRRDTVFDLRPLVDEQIILKDDKRLEHFGEVEEANANYKFSDYSIPAGAVKVLDRATWPPADLLHLDASQYTAIHTALTKEFVIVQGPPGTGKTYVGLKIVKALLHNKESWSKHPDTGDRDLRPMLIVCYTNHALDQFLEGIIHFYNGDVLRVGGRSNSEKLKPYNLHNFRQRFRHAQKVPPAVFQSRREAKNDMNSLMTEINNVGSQLQIANTTIIHEDFLQPFMEQHYHLLKQQFEMMVQQYQITEQNVQRNRSIIVEWLGLGNLAPLLEMEENFNPGIGPQNIPLGENDDNDEFEMIDVEGEIDAIQAQRQLDDGEGEDDELDDIEYILEDLGDMTRKQRNEIKFRLTVNQHQKAVALNVEHIVEKPRDMEEGEWQVQRKHKTKMKQKVQKNLSAVDCMTDEEANNVFDVLRLPLVQKWRLYRYWIKKYNDYLLQQIAEKEDEFEAAASRYREALMQEDREIMRHSTIVGMTTTGAARYQAVLQEIKPRIIVVEEAAEVLEAHIITTLSRGCEHLILIGDHKQLRPNPTVYKLAKEFNLDVSLFERMINNNIHCDCLELQHRMRPEIAELMKPIYPALRDHKDVKNYEKIKGISENICFVSHNEVETHDSDLRSHSNVHEAKYIVGLCNYLLLQGYKPEQITVLTLYSGQLFCLRGMMPKEKFEGVRVTVVDNYQGEENDIILLSLVRSNEEGHIGFLKTDNRVCVALSRAKKGLYAIGNFELLQKKSKLWNDTIINMKQKRLLREGLLLVCQNHPDNDGIVARTASDFDQCPEGGCNKKCSFRLPCGHVCEMFCHVIDPDHVEYVCKKECSKIICQNNHRCKKRCSAICGLCNQKIEKIIPKCGHAQQVPCAVDPDEFECLAECEKMLSCGHKCQSKCGMAHTQYCSAIIVKKWPCGHSDRIKCCQKDVALCPHPCNMLLNCEHRCTGTCGKCFQGRLHQPCLNDCNRILVCGHECNDRCNQCPPCVRECENMCQHSKCRKKCGEKCVPCMEPCSWRCVHFQCKKLCSEPCDRKRCNEPCTRRLVCDHQCIGLCGEPCPNDCRICDQQKVTELLFGDEDEPGARFVLLQDCRNRCIIESKAMDYYMDQKDDKGEIKLKECPKCKTPIRKSTRYRAIINKTLQDIEKVKETVLANKAKVREMEEQIMRSIETVDHVAILRKRLYAMQEPKSANTLAAIQNQIEIMKHLNNVEDDWNQLRGLAFIEDKRKALNFLEHFRDWVLEERTIMTHQETLDAELEVLRSRDLLHLLLYQQKALDQRTPLEFSLKAKVREAEILLNGTGKYEDRVKLTVEACLVELKRLVPLSGLGISEDEKLMIVKAMALPSGHWFKCPNGHVYAIADCGGATMESKCPECRATIGGGNHRLRDDNTFAGEMDGAAHPAWSEQANLANYDFRLPR